MSSEPGIFYANTCVWCNVVCKRNARTCRMCHMVTFCSKNHEERYLSQHKFICSVFQMVQKMKIENTIETPNLTNKKNWFTYRTKFMLFCELINKNKLSQNEINMILFPKSCEICHTMDNLNMCENCCCVNYCSPEHELSDREFHLDVCSSLKLCLDIDLYLVNNTHVYPDFDWSKTCHLTENTEMFVNTHLSRIDAKVEQALMSELLTCPLTLSYTLENLQLGRSVNIHVIGASVLETVDTQFWELILHLTGVTVLNLCFVGPELDDTVLEETNLCLFCKEKERSLQISFVNTLYHEFSSTGEFQTPDLIVMFNCGLHEYEGSDMDSWKDSLGVITELDCYVVLTSFTRDEADKDLKRIADYGRVVRWTGDKNPFCSLRPYRDLENLGVYFNNSFVSLVDRAGTRVP